MKISRVIRIAIAALILSSSLSLGQSNTITRTIRFTGAEDDQTAASRIFSALKANGETIEKFDKAGEVLLWEKKGIGKALVMPIMSADEVNRVCITKIWRVKFQYKHSDILKDLVWNANRQLNTASYSIESSGDFQIKGVLCFLDTLDLSLLEKYCTWLNTASLIALELVDSNYAEYFQ